MTIATRYVAENYAWMLAMIDLTVDVPGALALAEQAMLGTKIPSLVIGPVEATSTVPLTHSVGAVLSTPVTVNEKETKMADIVTGTVTGQLDDTANLQGQADIRREGVQSESQVRRDVLVSASDIRREQAEIGSNVRRENAKEASDVIDAVKTSAWTNSDRTGSEADRVVAQDTAYFIAGQSQNFANATALAALKAGTDMQFANTLAAIQAVGLTGQAATALEGAKTAAAAALAGEKAAAAAALGQALLGQQIVADGNATRALINSQKVDDLRNALLAERFEHGHRGHRDECYGHRGHREEGTVTYGPPVSATYPV
jgi:hypothetical protein